MSEKRAGRLPPHLDTWVRLPGPAKVVAAIRERAARGASTTSGTLRCALDAAERRQVARLLGNPWDVSGRPVRLQDLNVALGDLTPLRLAELVGGSVRVRAEERAEHEARRNALAQSARAALTAARVSEQHAEQWQRENPRALDLAEEVARVWLARPAEPIYLARLAADVCGDAHALDDDRALGRAVARLSAVVHELERPERGGPAWRNAWRAAQVLCTEVSSRVLVLNLSLAGPAPAAALSTASPGEPVWLTMRSLSPSWRPRARQTVFVCENPTVVEAAADRLGERCAPLVCMDGNPATAGLALVRGLAESGCEIRARADFDRTGLRIVERLSAAAPRLTPWRFDLDSYRDACGDTTATDLERACIGRPVHEEALLPLLLADLARGENQ